MEIKRIEIEEEKMKKKLNTARCGSIKATEDTSKQTHMFSFFFED
jgi:hypothetical protein